MNENNEKKKNLNQTIGTQIPKLEESMKRTNSGEKISFIIKNDLISIDNYLNSDIEQVHDYFSKELEEKDQIVKQLQKENADCRQEQKQIEDEMEILQIKFSIRLHELEKPYDTNMLMIKSKLVDMAREIEFNQQVLKQVHRAISEFLSVKGQENYSVGKIKERLTQLLMKTDYQNFQEDEKFNEEIQVFLDFRYYIPDLIDLIVKEKSGLQQFQNFMIENLNQQVQMLSSELALNQSSNQKIIQLKDAEIEKLRLEFGDLQINKTQVMEKHIEESKLILERGQRKFAENEAKLLEKQKMLKELQDQYQSQKRLLEEQMKEATQLQQRLSDAQSQLEKVIFDYEEKIDSLGDEMDKREKQMLGFFDSLNLKYRTETAKKVTHWKSLYNNIVDKYKFLQSNQRKINSSGKGATAEVQANSKVVLDQLKNDFIRKLNEVEAVNQSYIQQTTQLEIKQKFLEIQINGVKAENAEIQEKLNNLVEREKGFQQQNSAILETQNNFGVTQQGEAQNNGDVREIESLREQLRKHQKEFIGQKIHYQSLIQDEKLKVEKEIIQQLSDERMLQENSESSKLRQLRLEVDALKQQLELTQNSQNQNNTYQNLEEKLKMMVDEETQRIYEYANTQINLDHDAFRQANRKNQDILKSKCGEIQQNISLEQEIVSLTEDLLRNQEKLKNKFALLTDTLKYAKLQNFSHQCQLQYLRRAIIKEKENKQYLQNMISGVIYEKISDQFKNEEKLGEIRKVMKEFENEKIELHSQYEKLMQQKNLLQISKQQILVQMNAQYYNQFYQFKYDYTEDFNAELNNLLVTQQEFIQTMQNEFHSAEMKWQLALQKKEEDYEEIVKIKDMLETYARNKIITMRDVQEYRLIVKRQDDEIFSLKKIIGSNPQINNNQGQNVAGSMDFLSNTSKYMISQMSYNKGSPQPINIDQQHSMNTRSSRKHISISNEKVNIKNHFSPLPQIQSDIKYGEEKSLLNMTINNAQQVHNKFLKTNIFSNRSPRVHNSSRQSPIDNQNTNQDQVIKYLGLQRVPSYYDQRYIKNQHIYPFRNLTEHNADANNDSLDLNSTQVRNLFPKSGDARNQINKVKFQFQLLADNNLKERIQKVKNDTIKKNQIDMRRAIKNQGSMNTSMNDDGYGILIDPHLDLGNVQNKVQLNDLGDTVK